MSETKEQQVCPYCHSNGNVTTVGVRDSEKFERGQSLVGFNVYAGDFHIGADVYVSPSGVILLDTGDEFHSDYEEIKYCPICGRKLGD